MLNETVLYKNINPNIVVLTYVIYGLHLFSCHYTGVIGAATIVAAFNESPNYTNNQ